METTGAPYQLRLAEAEGNIEQLKHPKEKLNPDISNLSLEKAGDD